MPRPGQSSSSESEEDFDPNFSSKSNCAGSVTKNNDDEKVRSLCHMIRFKENRVPSFHSAHSFYFYCSLRDRQVQEPF